MGLTQRSYNCRFQNTLSTYSTQSTKSPGGLPASCKSAKIRIAIAGHLRQLVSRLVALTDVPTHNLDQADPFPTDIIQQIPDGLRKGTVAQRPGLGRVGKNLGVAKR